MKKKGKSYRELQADGQRELDRPDESLPPGLPDRSPSDRETRRAQLEPTWAKVVALLDRWTSDFTFHVWLADLSLADEADGILYLTAPRPKASWIRARYSGLIELAAKEVSGREFAAAVFDLELLASSAAGASVASPEDPDDETREG